MVRPVLLPYSQGLCDLLTVTRENKGPGSPLSAALDSLGLSLCLLQDVVGELYALGSGTWIGVTSCGHCWGPKGASVRTSP